MDRKIKFRALFEKLRGKEKVWLYSEPNHVVKDVQYAYRQLTEWLQYIGLKDENEIEIYEGDIIPITLEPEQYHSLKIDRSDTLNGYVKYNPIQCKYEIVFPENKYNIISSEFGWAGDDYKVIGNIYENDDLL